MHINDKSYELQKGNLLVLPPNTPHYLEVNDAKKQYRRYVFWLSRSFFESLIEESEVYNFLMTQAQNNQHYLYYLSGNNLNTIQALFLKLLEELNGQRYGKEIFTLQYCKDLLLQLNRLIYELQHPHIQNEGAKLFTDLTAYIEHNLNRNLTLDFLANELYVNKYYIAHLFKENLGISLHQYIQKKRLANARLALLNGEKPSAIHIQCGFHDYSAFYRAFKKEYGLSPKEYQAIYQNDPLRNEFS